jgi:hypothetical protein
MRSVFVVVADIVGKKSPQVSLVQWNHMIEQIAATAFDPALRDPVLPGTLKRGLDGINLH